MKITKSFIKHTGSKRLLLPQIRELVPDNFKSYYEPFLGSGICLLLAEGKEKIVGSDIEPTLICLWKLIKENPKKLLERYSQLWQLGAQNIYYEVRERYNKYKDPKDYYFLVRTCYNGLCRFNSKGEFNSPLHVQENRKGAKPEYVAKLLFSWCKYLNRNNIQIENQSYEAILEFVDKDSFIFLDPPYKNSAGMYKIGTFELDKFLVFLEKLNSIGSKWLFTFDGISDKKDNTVEIPKELYKVHRYFKPVKSLWHFHTIQESYYLNYDK